MALNRKYAGLPDLDSAPDIYETPDLTDDNSTVPTTTAQAHSDDGFDGEDDVADLDGPGISRARLRIHEARSRFLPSNVDASAANFSDRLDSKRKSYKTSSRRHRILADGTQEYGDLSDDDDKESLERRIARLRREVEEVREEQNKQQAENQEKGETTTSGGGDKIASLSEALAAISHAHSNSNVAPKPISSESSQPEKTAAKETLTAAVDGTPTYTITYAPTYDQSHTLAKTADFDSRLALLEKTLGVASTHVAGVDGNDAPRAIIPLLHNLDKQIGTLAQASTAGLDTTTRRVRTLAQEVAQLNEAQSRADAARAETTGDTATAAASESQETDQVAKINALYGTLPTIENLTPLLPPLLDRLRSLRAIHADAATASETLSRIEKQQNDMATELKQWRDGLVKVEQAVGDGKLAMEGNMKSMETWIKELEGRMAKLS